MRKSRWSIETINEAKRLRSQPCSYGEIMKKLGVPKSTLHEWLKSEKCPEKFSIESRMELLKRIQPLAVEAKRKMRMQYFEKMRSRIDVEVDGFKRDLAMNKMVLSSLYWAEGSKGVHEVLTFANTDPDLIFLFIALLRSCFDLDESKFRVRLHLHDYHDDIEQRRFWSDLVQIPLTQFTKTHVKQRSFNKKFRNNSHGICFIRYNSVYLKEELLYLGRSFLRKIAEGDN